MQYKEFKITDIGIFFIFHTIRRFDRDNALSLSAEAAYYLIMSFIPFMIFLINTILFFMASQVPLIIGRVGSLPPEIASVMIPNIYRIINARSSIWLFAGLCVALWTASQGMQVLVQASNLTFHQDRNKQNWVIVKIKSMIFMLFMTCSIVVSLGLTVFGNAAIYAVQPYFPLPEIFFQLWNWTKYFLPFSSLIVTLTIFYHFSPYSFRPKWHRALLISTCVTIVWLLITTLYSHYMLNISDMGITYGSLVGIIALFIWFRLIALAIITGSEILMTWQDFDVLRHKNPFNQRTGPR